MRGVVWCFWLTIAGVAVALLGVRTNSEVLMAYGGGAVALVWIGWPMLLVLGVVAGKPRRR